MAGKIRFGRLTLNVSLCDLFKPWAHRICPWDHQEIVVAVTAREVSRFARNSRDWHQLIEMCSLVDTLLVDQESVYDPRQSNDRLLLGLKGSLNEYELDLLRQRSLEARKAMAARGELVIHAPVGYLKTADHKLEKDPDRRVQRAIQLVFEKFLEIGSVRQTLFWFLSQDLQLPVRKLGAMGWETVWKRPYYKMLQRILEDPQYAGAYIYGKTTSQMQVRDGQIRKVQVNKPMDDWSVFIPDHHEGYISWETFQRIRRMISQNAACNNPSGSGAPKKGPALLGGLLRCRRCGRKLAVQYTGRFPRAPRYHCYRAGKDSYEQTCVSLGGMGIDDALSRAVLGVVQPAAIEAALMASREEERSKDRLIEALMIELKAARYAAERAWKQYDAVDPDNRLVADDLEQRWESALKRVREIEERIDHEQALRNNQVQPDAESLTSLAADLDTVWNDPQTDVRLKKRIIRTLIEEIIVDVDTAANEVDLIIHWKGGVHSQLRVPKRRSGYKGTNTSKDIVEAVRQLALVCTDKVIASFLSRNGLKTGCGNRFTTQRVRSLRNRHDIPKYVQNEGGEKEWMTLIEAAALVGVTAKTLTRSILQGDIQAIHPLADGPYVINREWLNSPRAQEAFQRARQRKQLPAIPSSKQINIAISDT